MKAVHLQLTQEKPAAVEEGMPGLALELVLPGVTVPWAHALYLWIATAVSLGVHEACCLTHSSSSDQTKGRTDECGQRDIFLESLWLLGRHAAASLRAFEVDNAVLRCDKGSYLQAGHALAAAAEGVGIHAVSFFLLLLLPGAYVTLNTDNLAVLGPSRALNVSSNPLGL